jgi:hypothetical protein
MSKKKKKQPKHIDRSIMFRDGGHSARIDSYQNRMLELELDREPEGLEEELSERVVKDDDGIVRRADVIHNEALVVEIGSEIAGLISKKAYLEKYDTSDKIISLALMEYSAKKVDGGNYEPSFQVCSTALNIPVNYLQEWWRDREVIIEASSQQLIRIPDMISTKLKFLGMELLEELSRRSVASLSSSEIIKLLGDSIKLTRLIDGKSTSNVAVNMLPGIDGHVRKK